ncbi:hypothetical protein JXA40_10250 [bacterium]|nr:hypothetical protein [candidate division CSSED10-310 bacterium]
MNTRFPKTDASRNLHLILILSVILVFLCFRAVYLIRQYAFQGIVSDATFRISNAPESGWYRVDFDDTRWEYAAAPYWDGYEIPDLHKMKLPGLAMPIWKADRSPTIFLRKTFHLDRLPLQPVELSIVADDDYTLFINGHQISDNQDRSTSFEGETHRIDPWLTTGTNIIAIRAINRALAAHLILIMPLPETGMSHHRNPVPLLFTIPAIFLSGWLLKRSINGTAWNIMCSGPEKLPEGLRPFAVPVMILGWLAWIFVFRRFPVYEMMPVQVTTPVHWGRLTVFAIAAAVLFLGTRRVLLDSRVKLEQSNTAGMRTSGYVVGVVLICMLAVGLRLYRYRDVPPGIFQDDALFMSEGERLIRSGSLSLWSDQMNGNATLMMYWNGLIALWVKNRILAMRLAPALLGVLTIALYPWIFRNLLKPSQILWMMLITAYSHYHINYSRIPWDQVTVPLFSATAFFMMVRGLTETRCRAAFIASGAAVSLGLYGYAGYRIMPFIVFGLAVMNAQTFKRYLRQKCWIGHILSALVVITPLGLFLLRHPGKFTQRSGLVDIFPTFMKYFDPIPALFQTFKTILMTVFIGDGVTPRHNTPGYPALDPVTGAFFLIGLSVLFLRRVELQRLFFWLEPAGTIILRGAILWWIGLGAFASSLTFEAPHFSRSINLQVPLFLVASLGVWITGIRWHPVPRRTFWIVVLLAAAGLNYRVYFIDKLKSEKVYEDCGHMALAFHDRLDKIKSEKPVPVLSVTPIFDYLTAAAIEWLHADICCQSQYPVRSAAEIMETRYTHPGKPYIVFVFREEQPMLANLQSVIDQRISRTDPVGRPEYLELLMKPVEEITAVRKLPGMQPDNPLPGWIARVYPNTGWSGEPVCTQIDIPWEFEWQTEPEKPFPSPFSIRWSGYLRIGRAGFYEFKLTSDDGSILTIDRTVIINNAGEHGIRNVGGMAYLETGYHAIELKYFDSRWLAKLKLEWFPPSGEGGSLPPDVLFHQAGSD